MANKNQTNSYLDNTGVSKYLSYSNQGESNNLTTNSLNTSNVFNTLGRVNTISGLKPSELNSLTDAKNFSNPLKYAATSKGLKAHLPNLGPLVENTNTHEFELFNKSLDSLNNQSNKSLSYTFEDLKSGNQSLLPGERTVRMTDKLNPQKNLNTDNFDVNTTSLNHVYKTSVGSNASYTDTTRFLSTSTTFPLNHNPVPSLSPLVKDLSFDRTFIENATPTLLQSKEESAPNMIFETY
jgi:hypothetical protein